MLFLLLSPWHMQIGQDRLEEILTAGSAFIEIA